MEFPVFYKLLLFSIWVNLFFFGDQIWQIVSEYWIPSIFSCQIHPRWQMCDSALLSWIMHHIIILLSVVLYRQVFHDGLKNNVETRHSVSLCLLFCPVGIFSHFITKSLTKTANRSHWYLNLHECGFVLQSILLTKKEKGNDFRSHCFGLKVMQSDVMLNSHRYIWLVSYVEHIVEQQGFMMKCCYNEHACASAWQCGRLLISLTADIIIIDDFSSST